jgi:hypothetical protein
MQALRVDLEHQGGRAARQVDRVDRRDGAALKLRDLRDGLAIAQAIDDRLQVGEATQRYPV